MRPIGGRRKLPAAVVGRIAGWTAGLRGARVSHRCPYATVVDDAARVGPVSIRLEDPESPA